MECERVEEYHKYGCDLYGHLVVVNYTKEMLDDPLGKVYSHAIVAEKLVRERYGDSIVRVLLSIPEFVCELK